MRDFLHRRELHALGFIDDPLPSQRVFRNVDAERANCDRPWRFLRLRERWLEKSLRRRRADHDGWMIVSTLMTLQRGWPNRSAKRIWRFARRARTGLRLKARRSPCAHAGSVCLDSALVTRLDRLARSTRDLRERAKKRGVHMGRPPAPLPSVGLCR